jgi:segregation and condensation protein B
VSRVDSARARARSDDGSTLVLLHPGEVTDAELAGHLVALLFAAAGPIAPNEAARLLEIEPDRLEQVCELLDQQPPPGLALQRGPERLQLTTAPGSTAVVERYLGAPPPVRLSRAALEALAVIAYRGPATRGDIDTIRGVNSDSAVATLIGRSLVAEVGRRESAGRPALLAITPECLQYLGVRSLDELPGLQVTEPPAQAISTSNPVRGTTSNLRPHQPELRQRR